MTSTITHVLHWKLIEEIESTERKVEKQVNEIYIEWEWILIWLLWMKNIHKRHSKYTKDIEMQ